MQNEAVRTKLTSSNPNNMPKDNSDKFTLDDLDDLSPGLRTKIHKLTDIGHCMDTASAASDMNKKIKLGRNEAGKLLTLVKVQEEEIMLPEGHPAEGMTLKEAFDQALRTTGDATHINERLGII